MDAHIWLWTRRAILDAEMYCEVNNNYMGKYPDISCAVSKFSTMYIISHIYEWTSTVESF